ncbi:MAG: SH3 domain-containing protein [Lachnospiraceae bacterium]|nr:SH3 domain-containing protein [Lachnospiraceae bacterium]
MKKQTISALLTALMICLTIAIVVVIVRIQMRGSRIEETVDSDSYMIQEVSGSQNSVSDNQEEEPSVAVTVLVAVPNANSSVNVRSGPGTEYNRLGSAYSNNEYEVLEILDNGWTKLLYSDQEAYINSEYVDYKLRTTDQGSILYNTPSEADLAEYMTGANVPSAGENPEEGDPEDTTAE